jgi:hypothetical protein
VNLLFVLARTLCARSSSAIAGAFALQNGRVLPGNDLVRDAIGFDLIRIAGLADA